MILSSCRRPSPTRRRRSSATTSPCSTASSNISPARPRTTPRRCSTYNTGKYGSFHHDTPNMLYTQFTASGTGLVERYQNLDRFFGQRWDSSLRSTIQCGISLTKYVLYESSLYPTSGCIQKLPGGPVTTSTVTSLRTGPRSGRVPSCVPTPCSIRTGLARRRRKVLSHMATMERRHSSGGTLKIILLFLLALCLQGGPFASGKKYVDIKFKVPLVDWVRGKT